MKVNKYEGVEVTYPTYQQLIDLLPAPSVPNTESFELRILKETFEIDKVVVVQRGLNELRVTFPAGPYLRARIWIKRVVARLDALDEHNFDNIVKAILRITGLPKWSHDKANTLTKSRSVKI